MEGTDMNQEDIREEMAESITFGDDIVEEMTEDFSFNKNVSSSTDIKDVITLPAITGLSGGDTVEEPMVQEDSICEFKHLREEVEMIITENGSESYKKGAKRKHTEPSDEDEPVAHTSPVPGTSGVQVRPPKYVKRLTDEQFIDMLQNSDWEDANTEDEASSEETDEDFDEEEEVRNIFSFTERLISPIAATPPGRHRSPLDENHSQTLASQINSLVSAKLIWTANLHPCDNIPFSGNPGLKIFPNNHGPIDYFFLLFSNDFIESIINETNYQGQMLSSNVSPRKAIEEWKNISRQEFETFLGVLFMSGQIGAPSYAHYWKNDELYNFPLFRNAMSCDRFRMILRALHFTRKPPPGEPKSSDVIFKVRPLLDFFHKRMAEVYYPEKELSLDQSMQLRKEFIEKNKHKFQVKFYMLTQSDGLVIKMGIDCMLAQKFGGRAKHIENIIKTLTGDFMGVGHAIYMDSFCSSVEMSEYLLEQKTYSTGIVKTNMSYPLLVVNRKLKRGSIRAAFRSTGICVLQWRDLLMVSSEFGTGEVETISKKGRKSKEPEVFVKYNEGMPGTDVADQLFSYYPLLEKTLRWYAKVGIYIFHTIMNNSYLLYKKFCPTSDITLLQFRDSVITSLICPNKPHLQQ